MTLPMRADVVVIGSSPLMLLRALEIAKNGRDVLIIDRAQEAGGSWCTPTLFGFSGVEVGVHLLENRVLLYSYIAKELGVELEPDGGLSFGLWNGKRIGIETTRVLLHSLVSAKALKLGAMDRSRRVGLSALRAVANLRVPIQYPRHGCAAITSALVSRLQNEKARFLFGTDIHDVKVQAGADVKCRTSAGDVEAEHLVLSSRAHAPVSVEGEKKVLQTEESETLSAVLHVAVGTHVPFNYVEIFKDPWLKRVRDVSVFAKPQLPAGERLICVQVRQYPPGQVGDAILVQLCTIGLVAKDTRLLGFARHDLRLSTITDRSLRQLAAQSGGRIEGLLSSDFAEGFLAIARRGT